MLIKSIQYFEETKNSASLRPFNPTGSPLKGLPALPLLYFTTGPIWVKSSGMDINNLEKSLTAEALNQNSSLDGLLVTPPKGWKRIIEDERIQQILLFLTAVLFGPLLTYILLNSPEWPISTKLNLSVVIYISVLYIVFSFFDVIINYLIKNFLNIQTRPNIVVEFSKFFLTLLVAGQYQYTFIYEPLFHYQRQSNLSIIFVTTALYSAVAAAIYYRFRQMKDIALKSKVAEAEAQYSLLESQMQPHFLFNSLNVLSELIYVEPDLANSMTQKLADLYREILNNSKNKFSTLDSEISILRKYIEIQKIRFGDRIRFNVDVSPAYYNLQVPSLMLQTLVENAIKHGISPKMEGGEINLSVKKKGSLFEVCISNTGALYRGHTESKKSTGLQNTRNRLDLTYGSKHHFEIYSDEQKTYVKFNITGRTS